VAKTEFNVNNQRLIIKGNQEGIQYSSLFIESDELIEKLGSESLPIIKKKLLPILKTISSREPKLYRGVNIVHLINLSEPHAAISLSPLGNGDYEMYVLDINDRFYPFMKLGNDDMGRLINWIDELKM